MHSPVNLVAFLALLFLLAVSPLGTAYPTELDDDLTPLKPKPIDGRNNVSPGDLNRRNMMIPRRSHTPANVTKRGSPNLPPLCIPVAGQDWAPVWFADVVASHQYLTNSFGDDGPGALWTFPGRGCQQLDCHQTSTVTVCLEYDVQLSVPTDTILDYIATLAISCVKINGFTGGQLFDTDGWNLIIQNGGCREEDKRGIPVSKASTNMIPVMGLVTGPDQ